MVNFAAGKSYVQYFIKYTEMLILINDNLVISIYNILHVFHCFLSLVHYYSYFYDNYVICDILVAKKYIYRETFIFKISGEEPCEEILVFGYSGYTDELGIWTLHHEKYLGFPVYLSKTNLLILRVNDEMNKWIIEPTRWVASAIGM